MRSTQVDIYQVSLIQCFLHSIEMNFFHDAIVQNRHRCHSCYGSLNRTHSLSLSSKCGSYGFRMDCAAIVGNWMLLAWSKVTRADSFAWQYFIGNYVIEVISRTMWFDACISTRLLLCVRVRVTVVSLFVSLNHFDFQFFRSSNSECSR